MSKFNEGFGCFLSSMGILIEIQIPIALAERIPGSLLVIGVLSRLSTSLLAIIMLGSIFVVKGAQSLTSDGGVELDLMLLTSELVIMIAGPKRISLAQAIKKLPRYLH